MRNTKMWKILVASIGAVGLATSSWAAVGQLATSTTNLISGQLDIKVADRLVTATSAPAIDLGGAATWPGNGTGVNRNLLYAPNIDVTTDSTIKFDFVNFTVVKTTLNKYYLRIAGAVDGTPAGSTWQVGTLVDFVSDAAGNYASMTFKVVPHDENGDGLVDANIDDRIGAAQVAVISATSSGLPESLLSNAPMIQINKGISLGATGTMAVPVVKDATGVSKDAPVAGAVKVFTLVNGLSAAIYNPANHAAAGNATSTIDVDPAAAADARKVFVSEGEGTDTPNTTQSVADLKVTNNAEYGFRLDAADDWTLVVKRSNVDGVSSVTINGAAMAKSVVAGVTQWARTSNFGAGGLDLSAGFYPITITATGTTVLQNGIWTADLLLDTDDLGNPGDTGNKGTPDQPPLLSAVTSHVWDTNGAQFAVPYFNTDTTRYGTYTLVTNRFGTAAGIQMDIWTDLGLAAAGIKLADLPPNTVTLMTPDMIQTAAQAAISGLVSNPNGSGRRYMAIFTVNAPADQIITTAFQNDPTGAKRTINVMTKGSDAKSWKW